MVYLLDTGICVFYLRGKYSLDKIFTEKGPTNCCISEITVAELRFGAENSNHPQKSHNQIDEFLENITIVPIFSSIKRYAKEKARLRKLGTPLHDDFDLLIGATAFEYDLVLVTDNLKHFERIEGIIIENWIPRL